ncbi:hypothetical protein NEMIN01_1834 [Nematocida minor]|uniref:uncharacterized protein n=1 Tax=Nematocida minor TaxID=1912983 RepID=UPI0022209151|nr:uncharacterized protein NEMIN01_1834 [Nematocida minor]KAI5192141.1 hypothetical protein NEMIN01_1834 [Nematocida minor]
MFETFTIRTKPNETSPFKSDSKFSLMKMLSLDPLRSLNADEFAAWVLLTLFICFVYYMYSLLKASIMKKIFARSAGSHEVYSSRSSLGKEESEKAGTL